MVSGDFDNWFSCSNNCHTIIDQRVMSYSCDPITFNWTDACSKQEESVHNYKQAFVAKIMGYFK
jgi:hypothetical protein